MSAMLNNKGFVLTLYRNILKEHKKKLPSTMRHLGDEYVKNEFRLHKAAKEEQVKAFVHAWTDYLTVMRRKEDTFGTNLGSEDLNALGEEQREKLQELKEETKISVDKVIKEIEDREEQIRPKQE